MRAQCTCARFGVVVIVVVPAAEATAEKLIFHSFAPSASTTAILVIIAIGYAAAIVARAMFLRQPVYVKVFEKMAKVR